MWRIKTVLVVMTCSFFLAACGQKGPLYIPQKAPQSSFTVTE